MANKDPETGQFLPPYGMDVPKEFSKEERAALYCITEPEYIPTKEDIAARPGNNYAWEKIVRKDFSGNIKSGNSAYEAFIAAGNKNPLDTMTPIAEDLTCPEKNLPPPS